jgi:DNA replication and repair protein RecF
MAELISGTIQNEVLQEVIAPVEEPSVFIKRVVLKNFRCFKNYVLDLHERVILLEGANGVGKTSFLEALYYACYLRSFRSHSPKEMVTFGQNGFFMQIEVANNLYMHEFFHDIQIGFSQNKKLVKVDQKTISSYKELMRIYRVISLTEDDLELIKGSPQVRRTFMDQALLLTNPEYITILRTYRQLLDQRNALLFQHRFDRDSYEILTQKLWEYSGLIQSARTETVGQFSELVAQLARDYFDIELIIEFSYLPKYELQESLQEFTQSHPLLYDRELRLKRTLFGAHLDDLIIQFKGQQARQFASRGQQKLVVLLIKIAQALQLHQKGMGGVILLDDFMTDFDQERSERLLRVLDTVGSQLIFTSPIQKALLGQELERRGAQSIKLTY